MDHILSKGYKVRSTATVVLGTCAIFFDDLTCDIAGAGATVLGVFQETLDAAKVTTGKATVGLAILGVTRVKLGVGGATRGARLKTDASAQGIVAAQVGAGVVPTPVFGIAMTAGNAGDLIDVLLTPFGVF
jgi:hypothetical protein